MQTRWTIAVAGFLFATLQASALPIKNAVQFAGFEESGRQVSIKSKETLTFVKLVEASDVVCLKVSATGSRLKKVKCKTSAQWKAEKNMARMRTYLINQ